MLKTLILGEDSTNSATWKTIPVASVSAYLKQHFGTFPHTAKIYHEYIALERDVTPTNKAEIEHLESLEGKFYCIVYPGEFITATMLIYAAIAAAVAVAAAYLLMPKIPNTAARTVATSSPNNELSKRTNSPRIKARIPDVFGEVRSTPDLIASPYTTFVDNQEVETCLMCIGVGQYEILDAYDGETLWSQVPGSSLQVYRPNTPVNSGAPYFQIGNPITEPAYDGYRTNSINGQTMRPPNSATVIGSADIVFRNTGKIISTATRVFSDDYSAGDQITISNGIRYANSVAQWRLTTPSASNTLKRIMVQIDSAAIPPEYAVGGKITLNNAVYNLFGEVLVSGGDSDYFTQALIATVNLSGSYDITAIDVYSGGGYFALLTLNNPGATNPQWNDLAEMEGQIQAATVLIEVSSGVVLYNLNGTYDVVAVSAMEITLSNPAAVNPQWNNIPGDTPGMSPTLASVAEKWIGPFLIETPTRDMIFANFIASAGLYRDDGKTQYALSIELQIQVRQAFENGTFGGWETFGVTMTGSGTNRETRASTIKATTSFAGRCQVRGRRVTPTDKDSAGSVVDEIKWRDLYAMSYIDNSNFGNVTVVRSQSYATAGALALKERKLNMLVLRQLPLWLGGKNFTPDLHSTRNAADIVSFISLDPFNGNRDKSEIDFDSIYGAMNEVAAYFGTVDAAQFCYTFDNTKLSYEEIVKLIAQAVFCNAYREGNVLKFHFERATDDSVMLFNHRNIIPGSENRSDTFGFVDDFDGIEFQYISPDDDAEVTIYLPSDRSAINANKVESVGVRNRQQAYLLAWRAYNKLRFQNSQIQFEATQEADLLVEQERVLIADGTRPGTQDGEIDSQDGLTVYTSQELHFSPGVAYTMFLQLRDKTTQAIDVTPGPVPNSATLAQAPRLALAVESGLFAKTTYILVGNTETSRNAFLILEKIPQDGMTSKISAANYDARYYERDKDFINGTVQG